MTTHSPNLFVEKDENVQQVEAEISVVVKSPSRGLPSERMPIHLEERNNGLTKEAESDATLPMPHDELVETPVRNNMQLHPNPDLLMEPEASSLVRQLAHNSEKDVQPTGTSNGEDAYTETQNDEVDSYVAKVELDDPNRQKEPQDSNEVSHSQVVSNVEAIDNVENTSSPNHTLRHRQAAKRARRAPVVVDGASKSTSRSKQRARRNRQQFPRESLADEIKSLPTDQYETTLIRRAIRKLEDAGASENNMNDVGINSEEQHLQQGEGNDIFGDVSLGMQLAPIEGKIVVQGIIPLKDGRASPAQLAGCIKRGDVLLQINHQSLVNIPFQQLMLSLLALSKPLPDGTYPRKTTLRFAAGQGLELLQREQDIQAQNRRENQQYQQQQKNAGGGMTSNSDILGGNENNVDGAADILGLFNMVDQLSGIPMFPEQSLQSQLPLPPQTTTISEPAAIEAENNIPSETMGVKTIVRQQQQERLVSLEDAISNLVAKEHSAEKEECESEFFSWNENFSILLRRPGDIEGQSVGNAEHNKKEMHAEESNAELGPLALKGARRLVAILERIDTGWSDRRSFHSLSATLSLYSKASTRRRYVLDSNAMPVNFEQLTEEEDGNSEQAADGGDHEENDSGSDEDDEKLDGDALLLQLAAQDEIWKKQVIEFLEDVAEKLSNPAANMSPNKPPQESMVGGATSALSSELGNFLFGDRMTKALMQNTKSQALPPHEITALLFDLTTNVSATVPDQIQQLDSNTTVIRSTLVPFIAMKKPSAKSNEMLATRFLLDDALPVWLKSFRPLPWEQRRVLWPLDKALNGDSRGSIRSDDSMTLDSYSTRQTQQSPSVTKRKSKNLREQIEDQELNVETRSEACFLVTFYFTQKLLPQLINESSASLSETAKALASPTRIVLNEEALQTAKAFVKEFGAYLRLHTCVAYAAVVRAHDIINLLLEVGKHDPLHQESMRRFSRVSNLFFYEPGTLSAVVQRLHNVKKESSKDQRLVTIQLCASAYPDVRPWQVDHECREVSNGVSKSRNDSDLDDLYYNYLTYLLHSTDGHDSARADPALVTEWCRLSVHGYLKSMNQASSHSRDAKGKRQNFLCVASKASSDHMAYKRDLPALLDLSMEMKEYLLALDLATEILDNPEKAKEKSHNTSVLTILRKIACSAIDSFQGSDSITQRILRRVLWLLQRKRGRFVENNPWMVNIPNEIVYFLNYATKKFENEGDDRLVALVEFFSREAAPKEFLVGLAKWLSSRERKMEPELFEVLRTTLRRGADDRECVVELSSALRLVRQARAGLITEKSPTQTEETQYRNLWKRLSLGQLPLAK